MRFETTARRALLGLVLASPAVVRADFPAPNPDELKMTSEPKAPGAAAVFLYREQITIDNKHYESVYERIKVLTEKGRELATVRIPYQKGTFFIKDVEGRTVHSDGTVVPLTVKPSDLVDFKTKGFQLNTIVFNLPSVEVGSILEYRVKLAYDEETAIPPTWQVQKKYFTREAHFQFHPTDVEYDKPARFATNLPDPTKIVKDKRGFTLDLTDVPALPDEDWMPPLNTVNWRVRFYYAFVAEDTNFWQTASGAWAGAVEEFIRPTPLLKNAVQGITAAADTPAQKAAKIYDAVMKLENTDFTREKSKEERKKNNIRDIKNAEDVWKAQSGNKLDIALLYISLARAAGLTVYPMRVVNRDQAIFDPQYHETDQLDDYIAVVVVNGKEVYLDPGEKMCAFGSLHWKHTLATGLRETEKGPQVMATPSGGYKGSAVQRIAELFVAADGTVSGNVRIVMSGPESLRWRQAAIENDTDEVKKQFNETLNAMIPEGVHAEFDHFLGLDDYNSVLVATAKVTGNVGTMTGKRMLLPGQFFESHAKHPFVAEDTRTTPIDVHHAQMTDDDVTYNLPAGMTMESAPQKTDLSWPQHGLLKMDAKGDVGSVTVTRSMIYNYVLLGPSDYSGLHDFYQKIATADQQQVVLLRGAATSN